MIDAEAKLREAWEGPCLAHSEKPLTRNCLRCALDACLDLLAEQGKRLDDADELVREAWNQWAYESIHGQWAGGLSTLESIEEYMKQYPKAKP